MLQEGQAKFPTFGHKLPELEGRIEHFFNTHPNGPLIIGRKPLPTDVHLSHCDYLALGKDRRIVKSQIEALHRDEGEIYMSGVFVQYLEEQRAFEGTLAEWLGTEDTVLCQSGFAANEGLIQVTANENTPFYFDILAHASLLQGALVAGAPTHPFRHNDAEHLRRKVKQHGPGVVAVDALYSTTGDLCRILPIVEVCEELDCLLIVDESHSLGMIGAQGEGLVPVLGLQDRVPIRVASFSKALVGRAGVVASSARFCEYFRYESRPSIFSSALMPFDVARFESTLRIVRAEGWRRFKTIELADVLRAGLQELGYDVSCSESQIIPLFAGEPEETARLRDALEDRGIMGAMFLPPATPRRMAMLRLAVNASLSHETVERILDAFSEIRPEVRPDEWKVGHSGLARVFKQPVKAPLEMKSAMIGVAAL